MSNAPHFDCKEIQQLYKSLKDQELDMDKAKELSEKYAENGHILVTEILQSNEYREFEEKKNKYFRERSECIREKNQLEKEVFELKENSETCESFKNLKPDLIAGMNNLKDIIDKLK